MKQSCNQHVQSSESLNGLRQSQAKWSPASKKQYSTSPSLVTLKDDFNTREGPCTLLFHKQMLTSLGTQTKEAK